MIEAWLSKIYPRSSDFSSLKSHHQKLYHSPWTLVPFQCQKFHQPPLHRGFQKKWLAVPRRILSHKLHRSRRSVKSSKPVRSSAQIKLVCNASRMPVRGAFTRHCPRVVGIVFILIYSLRSRVSSRAPRSKNAQKLGSWRKSGRRHIPPFSFLYFPKNLNYCLHVYRICDVLNF